MKGSTMGWIAKVSLWTVVMLQLLELTRGLDEGERGVCMTPITTSVFEYKSQRVCRRPYSQCSANEQKEQHTPFGYKCCKKRKPKTIIKPVCCDKWKWQKIDDLEKCLPICVQDCKNGRCVEPDKCECDAPLMLVNNECVAPECSTPCFNGICIAENTCECKANYKPYNVTHCHKECVSGYKSDPLTLDCVPICDKPCLNGICTSPNKCTCFDGYRFNDTSSTCSPTCDECVHGTCIAPNTCECNNGYKKENGRCVPVCDPPCNNGICSAPNICECNAGYEIDHKNIFDCQPTCYPNCVNASCVSPDTCSCLSGYKITGSKWICEPECEDCKHGDCEAPGECICHHGYAKKHGKCEPVCDEPCLNGFCSEPNVCTCNSNYELSVSNRFICEPVCEQSCVNAKCESPNMCTCREGYEPTIDRNICKPKCTLCDNGECVAPQECVCHDGYAKKNRKCEPVCDEPCLNGFCSGPNVCTCNNNYEPSLNNSFICEPVCEQSCVNAKCESPNTCTCLEGYTVFEATTDSYICKAKCTLCDHGECVAPQKCICHDGYAKKNGKCEPVCEKSCFNGVCSEPNVCTCDSHFKPISTDKFSCEPICETGCVNATCTSPNTCTCLTGYEPTTNDHVCKPKCKSCVHGECIAPNDCVCHSGYTMIDGKCNIIMSVNCETCKSNCSSGDCYCDNGTPCISKKAEEATSMAGLELSGALGGAVVLLLVILIVTVMLRIYRKRRDLEKKTMDDVHTDRYGSVVYTVPDTLLHRKEGDNDYIGNNDNDYDDNECSDNDMNPTKTDTLLNPKSVHPNENV